MSKCCLSVDRYDPFLQFAWIDILILHMLNTCPSTFLRRYISKAAPGDVLVLISGEDCLHLLTGR